MNSLELIHHESKYDLIWIDGDHSYPTAAIDISNHMLIRDIGVPR